MWLWDRESRGWTDTPQAPAVGSELFRPQTSPSCGVIWRVKLISEGLLGRPREMRHKTKPTTSSTPREVATYCIPASRARVWDAWRGPQLSQRPPPPPALSEPHTPKVTLERPLYTMSPQEQCGCSRPE